MKMTDTETQKTLITNAECATAQRLFDFLLILRAAMSSPSNEDEYWEKPWKWDREYQMWLEHGQPEPEDEAPFSRFTEQVWREV